MYDIEFLWRGPPARPGLADIDATNDGSAMMALLLLLSAPAATPAAAHGRTTRTLTRGWRFERSDLPFNGGPKLCVDDISTAFPIDLTGKQCAMGPRDAWSRITAGGDTNLPSDCARACCSSDNCTMFARAKRRRGTLGTDWHR